jgi:hypothetical protein
MYSTLILLLLLSLLYYFNNRSTSITHLQEPALPIFTHKQVVCTTSYDVIGLILLLLQFYIMRKLGQCGKYIRSLVIPLWTGFTVCTILKFVHHSIMHNCWKYYPLGKSVHAEKYVNISCRLLKYGVLQLRSRYRKWLRAGRLRGQSSSVTVN